MRHYFLILFYAPKKCPICEGMNTHQNGWQSGRHRYFCKDCKYRFQLKKKIRKQHALIWELYTHHKQTYREIAQRYGKSIRWVQNIVDQHPLNKWCVEPCKTAIVIDTCFFGRSFGVMIFRSPSLKKNVGWYEVKQESVEDYVLGIVELITNEFEIVGVTVDGKPGVLKAIERMGISVQMCQYHQIQIVTRYTTKYPRLQASKDLLEIVHRLTKTDRPSFEYWLQRWYEHWEEFLAEKTFDMQRNRWRYTHIRLRKAYRSLMRHMPYLFTYLDHPSIPNTTNSLESVFSHLKTKVKIHRGLKQSRKSDLIYELLR